VRMVARLARRSAQGRGAPGERAESGLVERKA
jgi:hypothetical protein